MVGFWSKLADRRWHRGLSFMRIAGWLLLIVGTLLCVSIVWATIGFLMMGLGLVCLLIAENRTQRAAAGAKPPHKAKLAQPPATTREPRFEPVEVRPGPAPEPRATPAARAAVVASTTARI